MVSDCGSDTAEMTDAQDAGLRVGPARDPGHLHVPLPGGLRQFRLGVSTLRKEAIAAWCEKRSGQGEQIRQGSERPRGDQVCRRQAELFDARGVNDGWGAS